MSSFGFDGLGAEGASLEEELEDIEQKQGEVVDLEEKERELERLRRRVNELGNEIRVDRAELRRRCAEAALRVFQPREPCATPWEQMKGEASGEHNVRHCGRCRQRVYDLSALPADEARRLIWQHEKELPKYLVGRVDGTVTVGSCAHRRFWRTPVAVALASAAAATLLIGGLWLGSLGSGDDPPAALDASLEEAVERALPMGPLATEVADLRAATASCDPCNPSAHCQLQWSWLGGSAAFWLHLSDGSPRCRRRSSDHDERHR